MFHTVLFVFLILPPGVENNKNVITSGLQNVILIRLWNLYFQWKYKYFGEQHIDRYTCFRYFTLYCLFFLCFFTDLIKTSILIQKVLPQQKNNFLENIFSKR